MTTAAAQDARHYLLNWGFGMQTSLKFVFVAVLWLIGAAAWSDCACFCVEGSLKTLCTDASEAQSGANLCPASDSAGCPPPHSADTGSTYEAPNSAATNCRDVRVYDAIRGTYVTAKACDVI